MKNNKINGRNGQCRFARAFSFVCLMLIVSGIVALTPSPSMGAIESSSKAKKPVIAFVARIAGNADRFRLLVDFDSKIEPKANVLNEPKRLIIDLPETIFTFDEQSKNSPSPLVNDFRHGTIAPGRSRIILSLADSTIIKTMKFDKVAGEDRFRLILDAVKASEADFAAAAKKGEEQQAGGLVAWKGDRIVRAEKKSEKFVIVIDPGHGGIDGGAQGKGKTIEKNVTLKFALALRAKLQKHAEFEVLMTREDDSFVRLQERLAVARRNHADLMISVHADSLKQKSIRGATIYTLSEEGTDELSKELADEQNRTDLIAGLELPKMDAKTTDILIDLTRRETEVFSVRFARMLVEKMQEGVRLIKNPHRSADFFVLRAADIPSILLELGYLSNKHDEKLMRSAEWHERVAERMRLAIVAFFGSRVAAQ